MDFMFAGLPWFITWPLNLKRGEKIGLCVTLSLGMMYVQQLKIRCPLISKVKVKLADEGFIFLKNRIAIVTAIRTWWKDTPLMHVHDFWCKYSSTPTAWVTRGTAYFDSI